MSLDFSSNFRPLFALVQYFALTMIVIIFLQIAIFVITPPPMSVNGFFELFRRNALLGLLSLDFLYLLNNMILIVIYLALFVVLLHENPSVILLAFLFGAIGIACYYPPNPAFEMWKLSKHFAQEAGEAKLIYIAAGEAVMAGYAGTTFNAYYVLSTISLILFSYVLLKSTSFTKSIGISGMASGLLMIVPSSAGMIGMIFSLLSLIPWVVFIGFLGHQFRKLACETSHPNHQ